MMNRSIVSGIFLGIVYFFAGACSQQIGMSGEALFNQRCTACHPNGGNTINPQKTLRNKDLEANHIKTPGDIVSKMRNPGVGMPRFERDVIPDDEAMAIARYIQSTFK